MEDKRDKNSDHLAHLNSELAKHIPAMGLAPGSYKLTFTGTAEITPVTPGVAPLKPPTLPASKNALPNPKLPSPPKPPKSEWTRATDAVAKEREQAQPKQTYLKPKPLV